MANTTVTTMIPAIEWEIPDGAGIESGVTVLWPDTPDPKNTELNVIRSVVNRGGTWTKTIVAVATRVD